MNYFSLFSTCISFPFLVLFPFSSLQKTYPKVHAAETLKSRDLAVSTALCLSLFTPRRIEVLGTQSDHPSYIDTATYLPSRDLLPKAIADTTDLDLVRVSAFVIGLWWLLLILVTRKYHLFPGKLSDPAQELRDRVSTLGRRDIDAFGARLEKKKLISHLLAISANFSCLIIVRVLHYIFVDIASIISSSRDCTFPEVDPGVISRFGGGLYTQFVAAHFALRQKKQPRRPDLASFGELKNSSKTHCRYKFRYIYS